MKPTIVLCAAALGLAATVAGAQGGPTDPQIAAIVVTANQVDIDAGKLAKSRPSPATSRVRAADDHRSHGREQVSDRAGAEAARHARAQPHEPESQKAAMRTLPR